MPEEDIVKQEGQQTISDSLQSIGEAALAMGAGAALFYRTGGQYLVSDQLNRLNRAMSKLDARIGNDPLQRSVSEWLEIAKESKDIFKNEPTRSAEDFLLTPMRSNILSNLAEAYQLRNGQSRLGVTMYASELGKLVEDSEVFKSLPFNVQEEVRDILPKIIRAGGDEGRMIALRTTVTGSLAQSPDVLNAILNIVSDAKEKLPLSQYMSDNPEYKRTMNQIADRLTDVSQLEDISMRQQTWGTRIKGQKLATVRDILDPKNIDLFRHNIVSVGNNPQLDMSYTTLAKNYYQQLMDQGKRDEAEKFLNMSVSSDIFVDRQGYIHSYHTINAIEDELYDVAASSTPGRVLKARDTQIRNMEPTAIIIPRGSLDPTLQSALNNRAKNAGLRTSENVLVMNGRPTHWIDKAGNLIPIPGSEYLTVTSTQLGSTSRIMLDMMDKDQRISTPRGGWLRRKLDIGQTPEWGFNRIEESELTEFLGDNAEYFRTFTRRKQKLLSEVDSDFIYSEYSRAHFWYRFMSSNTYAMNDTVLRELRARIPAYDMDDGFFTALRKRSSAEIIAELKNNGILQPDTKFLNPELTDLIARYNRNPQQFDTSYLRSAMDPERFADDIHARVTYTGRDMLRIEIQREMLMRIQNAHMSEGGFAYIDRLIQDLENAPGVKKQNIEEARRFAMFAAIQNKTHLGAATKTPDLEETRKIVRNLYSTLTNDSTEENRAIQDVYSRLVNQRSSRETRFRQLDENVLPRAEFGADFMVQHRTAASILSGIKNINDATKRKAAINEAFKTLYGETTTSINNPYRMSYISRFTNFMVSRLNSDLNKGNLNAILGVPMSWIPDFSISFGVSSGKGGFWQTSKSLMLKRVLPIAIGLNYFDWINDTQRELTGQSTVGAIESGAENVELAGRSFLDAIGVTPWLKDVKEASPIFQYLSGDYTPYQSAEEHRKWLQEGYEPVRRGRYWIFGSANEFRGSSIMYWRPNSLRVETSNARDVAIYGSYESKWSHSFLPTPSNPLSTFNYLFDPYYLERMHYYDRPYPLTGPLFEVGTPWGAVLNPTIGELIKPVRRMHEGRMFGGVDMQALLYTMNQATKRKAENNNLADIFVVRNGKIEPMDFLAYNAPTDTERIVSAQYEEGRLQNVYASNGLYQGGVSVSDYASGESAKDRIAFTESGQPVKVIAGTPGNTDNTHQNSLSATEELQLSIAKSAVGSDTLLSMLGQINRTEKERGSVYPGDLVHYDASQGIIIPSKFRYERSDINDLINQADAIEDAIHSEQGMGFVHEMAVSMRMLSGIYGYMASGLGDYGEMNRAHIATSQDITSTSRAFWDQSYGGLGGDVMEIIRRVIPTYGRYTAINPLMNTMPDWLPERYRTGDPYAKVPEGELRLPGPGYERLHRLHPDVFGKVYLPK